MKVLIIALFVVFLFTACDEKPKNPVAEYGDTMINSYKKGQAAGEATNLEAVRKAVQAYHASNDRYPQALDEVKPLIGSEIDVSKYDYDSQTGAVSLKGN